MRVALVGMGGAFAGWLAWDTPILTVAGVSAVILLVLFFNSLVAIAGPNPRMIPFHGAVTSTCLYLIAAVIIYCAAAALFASVAYAKVKEYPFVVAPDMEKYWRFHGNYPETLSELPGLPPEPRGLHYEFWPGYKFGDGYHFDFNAGSFNAHIFSMRTKNWDPLR